MSSWIAPATDDAVAPKWPVPVCSIQSMSSCTLFGHSPYGSAQARQRRRKDARTSAVGSRA